MINKRLVSIAKRTLKENVHSDDPVNQTKDIMGSMCGTVSGKLIDVAVETALKALETELRIKNLLLISEKINRRFVEIARDNLEVYDDQDDPPAVVKKELIEDHGITESEADRVMKVAQIESEFQKRVDEEKPKKRPKEDKLKEKFIERFETSKISTAS